MKDSQSPPDAPAPVGARREESSLFSLDMLKKQETEAASKAKSPAEESGLIDLKQLALIAKEGPRPDHEMAVAAVVVPPDLFQVSGPLAPIARAPASVAPPAMQRPAGKSKLLVAAGVAVVVLGGIAAVVITQGSSGAATAPGASATAATPPAPPTGTPGTTAAPAPEEPKAAAVTPGQRPAPPEEPKTAAPAATAPKAAVGPKPAPGPGPGPGPKAAPAAKAEAPKPPADTCDLACQMQRAVSGKK